uniref:Protein kinase domain-containing protein n=1 Tax=Physcomitrium patens TaxID=3218 RepID=A0A2K1KPD1_PHYPA|nr:hypothetical protein PHYPA_006524 [Physcomitrium patens]
MLVHLDVETRKAHGGAAPGIAPSLHSWRDARMENKSSSDHFETYDCAWPRWHCAQRSVQGQDVAIKLLEWAEENTMKKTEVQYYRNEFRQEVAVWHKLDHPNVTEFIGASMGNSDLQIPSAVDGDDGFHHVPNNACCVVVEYLAGGTLKEHLIRSRQKKLSYKVVVQLAWDVSRGLAYLHSQKLIHRGVKTENMFPDI